MYKKIGYIFFLKKYSTSSLSSDCTTWPVTDPSPGLTPSVTGSRAAWASFPCSAFYDITVVSLISPQAEGKRNAGISKTYKSRFSPPMPIYHICQKVTEPGQWFLGPMILGC